jgi:hypothetical protein
VEGEFGGGDFGESIVDVWDVGNVYGVIGEADVFV